MSKFSERFKLLRKERGLSQAALATELGFTKSSVNMYERGDREPGLESLETIADFFNVDMDYLLGKSDVQNRFLYTPASDAESVALPDNILPMPVTYTVPLLGTIACGEPILAAENIEDNVEVPEHIHADFALRCKGDSMINARIHDGDIVYIRQQPAVNNGEIAAVLIGDEATLKRVYVYEDHVVLQPENPAYEPLVYFKDAMQTVRILGKAVGFTSLLP
ncbi:MAG: LexA family transcriptional regulator [Oscillospiraceae bacterium]